MGPTGVAVLGVPVEGLVPTCKGVQSSSERKPKEYEGGSEISANGKEDSSKVTWCQIII
jgi:hypothetical protein